ncbi:LuxR C-terminal-related transcriptional regulator [Bradyrhizobium sp. STM 3557]|uniref:LuxR C-terminal-related transcriptional regulator n=1 Tax=Bradyrhizobium sp. STM 3557 TaxID=578920 RepID=UPI00388D7645
MRCINILIANRYPVVELGLRRVIGRLRDFKVVACCHDGVSCVEALRRLRPDVAIIDISMPGLTGLQILSIVSSEGCPTRVILFAKCLGGRELVMAAEAGAYGVLVNDVSVEVLVQSLRQVANGQKLLSLPSSDQLSSAVAKNAPMLLTEREREVMRLVSLGLSNKEIARRLKLADGTIKVHLRKMFHKLAISNRTELAALAISQNESATPPVEDRAARAIAQRRG